MTLSAINYPNSDQPMVITQQDGSVYHYDISGKKILSVENHVVRFFNSNDQEVFNVTSDTENGTLILLGKEGKRIVIDEVNGEINITAPTITLNGDVNINGTFNTN